MIKKLTAPDLVILAYLAIIVSILIGAGSRLSNPAGFIALNLGMAALVGVLAAMDRRREGSIAGFLHDWAPVLLVPACFKQIGPIVGGIHHFQDRRWDLALEAWDGRLFGDTAGFFRAIAWPPLADLLSLCYWSYFLLPIILGIGLYRMADHKAFRETTTILLVGWFLSYLGYFIVPAVGPHHFETRPEALAGWVVAGPLHQLLLKIEGSVPDAFPSGHALIAMLILHLSWRHHRKWFRGLAPVAVGLILSTMYLRYHYIVDVAASAALVPLSIVTGRALAKRKEPEPI